MVPQITSTQRDGNDDRQRRDQRESYIENPVA
jgi:hypothetical protein